MLTFYPEFEVDNITDNEIVFMLDLSNSMKVQVLCPSLHITQCLDTGRSGFGFMNVTNCNKGGWVPVHSGMQRF